MKDIPDYGDVMTLKDFMEGVASGCLTNDDGSGYYATPTSISDQVIRPSDVASGKINYHFTHVVWFNK